MSAQPPVTVCREDLCAEMYRCALDTPLWQRHGYTYLSTLLRYR